MDRLYLLPLLGLFATMLTLATVTSDDVTVTADVSGYITVTFNYDTVAFGSVAAGSTQNAAPGNSDGAYNVTVDANANYKVEAYGTDFSDGANTFSISNLKLDTGSDYTTLSYSSATSLSTTSQVIETNIPYSVTTHYHAYWLDVPSGQPAGSYSSTVTITYSLV